jgi:hypothetical protein
MEKKMAWTRFLKRNYSCFVDLPHESAEFSPPTPRLGIELRASNMLSAYHLSHASSPFVFFIITFFVCVCYWPFEHRALYLLGRHYHLSQAAALFALVIFYVFAYVSLGTQCFHLLPPK